MRLKIRGQIFQISEALDSLVLPVCLDLDQIEVVSDTTLSEETGAGEGLDCDAVMKLMKSMLATNTTIEECAQEMRAEVMVLSEKPWLIYIGILGKFAYEDQTSGGSESIKEQIVLKAGDILMIIRAA